MATIRITIDSANLGGKSAFDALWGKWKHCPPFNYVPATLEYESPDGAGNVICENVGIRARGSRRATGTQGLKLDMQVLDTSSSTHRRFADLNRINFLSNEGDNSLMIQCLAYKALREVGIPAPRCNHIKVYLNDQLYGVLQNVEQPNKGFCRRHFGSNQGFLFAASPSQDCPAPNGFADSMAKLVYSGDSFSSYTSQYMLDSATSADGEKTLIPMLKCGDATATPDDSTFKTCIAEWLDVTEWLRVIAAESLMPEMQSWIGYYRNYYLYFSPDSSAPHGGKFAVWTWDLDSVYQKSSCSPTSCDPFSAVDSLYGPLNTRAKLVKRLTTVFKSEYCTVLKDFLSKGFKPSLVDDMAKVIESSVGGSSVSTTAWQSEVSTIRNYFTTHASQMQTTVNSACQ